MNTPRIKTAAQLMKQMRMRWTAVVALVSVALLMMVHPEQLTVLLLKINLVALAGWGGYLIDRELFPYDRVLEGEHSWAPQIRRAIVVGASMLALALAI